MTETFQDAKRQTPRFIHGLDDPIEFRPDIAHTEFIEIYQADFKKKHKKKVSRSEVIRIALDEFFHKHYP